MSDVAFDEKVTEDLAPRVLPFGWKKDASYDNKWVRSDGLSVIASGELIDGKRWWHVSVARPNRLPSWEDVSVVKRIFVGRTRLAVQVLPREEEYVNHHPYCFHLWHCIDGDPVPDFRRKGGTL